MMLSWLVVGCKVEIKDDGEDEIKNFRRKTWEVYSIYITFLNVIFI